MKKFFALILVAILGFYIFSGLYMNEGGDFSFKKFGEANLSDRVSDKYVNKNVNGDTDEVVFGKSNNLESGSSNVVTSIVVNYRSFDTLGEVTVLFISALGVALLFGGYDRKKVFKNPPSFILKYGTRIIFGIILMTGIYIFVHGHLTPGGGFPGGSMIASAILLMYISDDEFRVKFKLIKVAEGIAGSLYVIAGLVGLFVGGYFLYNFLPSGTLGNLASAGLIPVIYILVGLKVGSELSGIVANFLAEEVES